MSRTELIDEFTKLQEESQRILAVLYKVVLELEPNVKIERSVAESPLVSQPVRVLPYSRRA